MLQLMVLFMTLSLWAQTYNLDINITGMKSSKGHILYILFNDPEGFPDDPSPGARKGKIKAEEGTSFQLEDLPPGEYSLSVIHDENDNDKLDTNFLGIPKEGFGFSNNPKILFGAPSFEKCSFKITGSQVQHIKLKHF